MDGGSPCNGSEVRWGDGFLGAFPHLHREGSQVTGCHLSRFYRVMTPVKSFDSSSTALR